MQRENEMFRKYLGDVLLFPYLRYFKEILPIKLASNELAEL